MDRELMGEFIGSQCWSPDFGRWYIREKAAQGLTFCNVPPKCRSRNFVGLDCNGKIEESVLIHHLPDNYAFDPNSPLGKVPIRGLIQV